MRTFNLFILFIAYFNANSQIDSLLLKQEHYALPNGLEVVLQPDKTVKGVSVEFWLKSGTSIDTPKQYGLQHFFEHVMPYSPMDSIKRQKLFDVYYENSNAQVKKDFTRFYWESKPEGVGLVLERTSGRLKAGANRITERQVNYQRKRVLEEIERNSKNPLWSSQERLLIHENTFGKNHPYTATGYGTIENNKEFLLDDFRKRYNQIVYSNNVILFVVGNFDTKEVKSLIIKHFSDIPSKQKLPNNPKYIKVKQSTKQITLKAPHLEDSTNTMVFSWAIPKLKIKEDAIIQLIASHLNTTFSAETYFPSSVLKSSVDAHIHMNAGQFLVQVQFENAKDSIQIKELVLNKIHSLAKTLLTESDIENARKLEIDNMKDKQKHLGFQWSRTELLGKSLLFYGDPNAYFERLKLQQNLTRKKIKKATKKWFLNAPFEILFTANNVHN